MVYSLCCDSISGFLNAVLGISSNMSTALSLDSHLEASSSSKALVKAERDAIALLNSM